MEISNPPGKEQDWKKHGQRLDKAWKKMRKSMEKEWKKRECIKL